MAHNTDPRKHTEQALDDLLRFESLLSDLFARFLDRPSSEMDGDIEWGLRHVAEFLQVDQAALFEHVEPGNYLRLTHCWTDSTSHATRQAPPLNDFHWAAGTIGRGEAICFAHPAELPENAGAEKAYLASNGPESAMVIPLRSSDTPVGALLFATQRTVRVWRAEQRRHIHLVGEVFANALQRRIADQARRKLQEEIERLQRQLQGESLDFRDNRQPMASFGQLIGQSACLKHAALMAAQVAPTDATVLLLGETGTGKELLAQAIHRLSPRKDRPMIKVNCAALPANLIESELFGREKGAFTGAQARQVGRFEMADGGTVFLDEIGDLPPELQTKLLRILQDGEFERLGSPRTHRVNVRIIAATNRSLEEEMRQGRFREDLYYRLQVYPITLPPLRERREDIPLLASWFVQKYARKMGKAIHQIPECAMEALLNHRWPGNVRELQNVIERAVINTEGSTLNLGDMLSASAPIARKKLNEMEAEFIRQTLETCRWRIEGQAGAAAALGLNPSTLRGRMQKLGIYRTRK